MRKLVTIRQISAIEPIPDADAIEVATIDGWKVVVKKGEFEVGQHVLYFEIDSILPEGNPAFDFLMARGCKDQTTDQPGVTLRGHRLRTIKLRGQVSQGLVLPIPYEVEIEIGEGKISNDEDLTAFFGVKKYEKLIPASLAGQMRGEYPQWMPKTDQERIQNCFNDIPSGEAWCIEEKIEGSSITIYFDGETAGVTSRNMDLKLDQEGNTFVDVAKASGLLDWLAEFVNYKFAFRGELVGPGIQGNIYNLKDFRIYIYDIWWEDHYLDPVKRRNIMDSVLSSNYVNKNIVFKVPVVIDVAFTDLATLDSIILGADGQSMVNPATLREGLVYKTLDYPIYSFKAISNKYLLEQKE